ncbi:hypothetical protein ElyMa_003231400 [Elysia marginata]|uniref:Uncharacterized protein n=1 Tax=Elysia marginata TaxID=1093978 RepID=A0AAV4J449_9GAST|nr:hypothetical protein ElyMa_003231400 [Elysia marginata]
MRIDETLEKVCVWGGGRLETEGEVRKDVARGVQLVVTPLEERTSGKGQWNPPNPGPIATTTASSTNSGSSSNSQNLLQRAYDLQRKDKVSSQYQPQQQQQQQQQRIAGQRALSSDDSAVFAASRSSQQLAVRHGKRRGESFK